MITLHLGLQSFVKQASPDDYQGLKSVRMGISLEGDIHECPLNFTPNPQNSREDKRIRANLKKVRIEIGVLSAKTELIKYDALPWLEHRLGGRLAKRVGSVTALTREEKKKEVTLGRN
ncbi:hypothetical protein pb186bvf_016562 [Paramecium bursaria]